jgi:hypothetical protein
MSQKTRLSVLALAGLMLSAAPLAAQDVTSSGTQPALDAQSFEMTWSDPAFDEIAGMLMGSWKTTSPVAQIDDPSATSDVIMSFGPAKISSLPNALYVETARADSPDQPYRAAFLQFYRRQGEIRMRTLEVRDPNNPINNLLIGMWAIPNFMPDVSRDAMIATLDMEFTKTADGWVGETPYPYPTAIGGATEMTSRMAITDGRIETGDRGLNADGNVVWGAGQDSAYFFERVESPFALETDSMGVIMLTLRDEPTADLVDGDTVAFQYTGWLTNGSMFDTSRRQGGRPYQYTLPASAVEGWNIGTFGMTEGDWKKFIVPSDLGYGPSSAAGGRIPANSTLIFEAELSGVRKADSE